MVQEFYERYPLGRIWGDLIAIHEGQYLVRVVLFDQERPLVSAMAMGISVETAEDLARERSLSLLLQSQLWPSQDSPEPRISETSSRPTNSASAPPALVSSESNFPTITSTQDFSFPAPQERARESSVPSPEPTPEPTPEPPTDDSDLLVQTTLELRRLGWDAEQGRVYLEQTYGKRSRQQLTRPELESFLEHLQGMGNGG